MDELKAVTIWQPWAQLIALGLKRYETRSWPTSYRGQLLIHASKKWGSDEIVHYGRLINMLACQFPGGYPGQLSFENALPLGKIVALCDLVECWHCGVEPPPNVCRIESCCGDFGLGRYAWQLENMIHIMPPIEARGAQGLWNPDAEIVDTIRAISSYVDFRNHTRPAGTLRGRPGGLDGTG
jgi:activating signal cointegrator 1